MNETLILTGFDLTTADVLRVANGNVLVKFDDESLNRVRKSREIVLKFVKSDQKIYGLNTGVGQNKDTKIPPEQISSFNRNLIYSHLVAIGDFVPENHARAALLIKLNSFLRGNAGVSEEIVHLILQLLNKQITPVMKATSSIGESDLGTLAFLGLVLIGEGNVFYKGQIRPTADVFNEKKLNPVKLGAKDALSIVSSNAYSQALTVFAAQEIQQLLTNTELVYSLSLEAIDGNITPLVSYATQAIDKSGYKIAAEKVLSNLTESYLLENHVRNSMQDPLSFRNFAAVSGALYDALNYLTKIIANNLVISDENPFVDLENEQIFSTCNYDTTNVALAFEMVNTALSQLARMSVFRTLKLGDSNFTSLPRFLSASENMLGFQTLQKTAVRLEIQIQDLTNTATNNFYPISSGIEDYATNLLLILSKNSQILSHFNYILAIESLSAAQAVDLKNLKQLGWQTGQLYSTIRKNVPFLDTDRNLSELVEKISQIFVKPAAAGNEASLTSSQL